MSNRRRQIDEMSRANRYWDRMTAIRTMPPQEQHQRIAALLKVRVRRGLTFTSVRAYLVLARTEWTPTQEHAFQLNLGNAFMESGNSFRDYAQVLVHSSPTDWLVALIMTLEGFPEERKDEE